MHPGEDARGVGGGCGAGESACHRHDRERPRNNACGWGYRAHRRAQLGRRGIDIDAIVAKVAAFGVAIPSWGVGTGGTRFARFPGPGEPRGIFEKLDDCAVINQLTRATPTVSCPASRASSTASTAPRTSRRAWSPPSTGSVATSSTS